MKKLFLSFVFLGSGASVYGCNEKFFASGSQENSTSGVTPGHSAASIPSASQATFYVALHLSPISRSSSPVLSQTPSSEPIAIKHRRSPSLSEILTNNVKENLQEETGSPTSPSSVLMLRSPHSETPSVLSATSDSSTASSSPKESADVFSLARDSALSSFNETGLEQAKREQFMSTFLTKFNASLPKNRNSQSTISSSSH